jgi:hypothetical protein
MIIHHLKHFLSEILALGVLIERMVSCLML